jgi:hypothetical protein
MIQMLSRHMIFLSIARLSLAKAGQEGEKNRMDPDPDPAFKRIRIQPSHRPEGSSLRADPDLGGSLRIRFSPGSQSAYVTCRLDVQVVVLHVLDVLEGGLHLLLHLFILLLGGEQVV